MVQCIILHAVYTEHVLSICWSLTRGKNRCRVKPKEVYDESMKYQFIIKSKRGKDISWYNTNEQEILFRRGSCFVVTDRKGNTIYMEEV